ncbi:MULTISPECIES: DUF1659 domain-containing protein [Clostridium]|uniref:DUF1659 domain-containing protein n=2 Tax=Clostridium novyi TaxID=1542 RepID=A0Q3K2_CLONN|nr:MULTISPECIES: DUF1659 domain-containing protein [Clostridium]ABK61537.1 conserved hypothetical protein [Clostridium novyi NT]KEH86598.1 hypothetical protein Z966_02470 [Clostridium novyi A str. NCTC 538]KEH89184.1 hypothetical protein Z967_11180 [Clostridium novyi A str. 4540]KEH90285.1 hypothetical protein Z965_01405 [Clostridium novyi A str. BKT29909]KEH94095.1 hypothetical protein Z963_11490 [Clostridium botulinum C/D str. It1]
MINVRNYKSSLVLKYLAGADEKGRDVFKTQKLQKLIPEATDEDVFDIALEIKKLLRFEDVRVFRENNTILTKN